uniref:Uncharacterized protein n=1 Tax=Janibacter limosus TaxID=53458 RepID=A0AC61U7I0_9MICO|nr:hypothetical protein [Janibacter limosus]
MTTEVQHDPLVDKATRLFTFLAKAQRLKERPVRDVEQYKRGAGLVRWFSDLPAHAAVRWSDADGADDQPLLVIDRLDPVDPPEMPTGIGTRVDGGGLRCDEQPGLRAYLVTGRRWDEETDAMVDVRVTIEEHPEVQGQLRPLDVAVEHLGGGGKGRHPRPRDISRDLRRPRGVLTKCRGERARTRPRAARVEQAEP